MQAKYTIKWLVLFLIIIKCVNTFEIFIKKTNDNNHQTTEQLKLFYNKTYEIPLFQTRYITLRISRDGLRRTGHVNQHDIVGFKFQVKSTDIRVVKIQKEVRSSKNVSNTNNILLEDLFIRKLKYFIQRFLNF